MRAFVEGVGLLGPGLASWSSSRSVIAGAEPYRHAATVVTASDLLPPAERRRTGLPVKLALAAGREAFEHAARHPSKTATVFTGSSGDGDTLHQICEVLASAEREVSPTRFHNSVHNAAAGYWGIATRSQEASTSLGCYDVSFAGGLLECMAQVVVDGKPVALIAYDQPYPEPLHSVRRIGASFAVALVLVPEATPAAFASIEVELADERRLPTRMSDPGLEAARSEIPAARSLPLLGALARRSEETVVLEYLDGTTLRVKASPCA